MSIFYRQSLITYRAIRGDSLAMRNPCVNCPILSLERAVSYLLFIRYEIAISELYLLFSVIYCRSLTPIYIAKNGNSSSSREICNHLYGFLLMQFEN